MIYSIEAMTINTIITMRDLYLKILYDVFRNHTSYNHLKHTCILRACFITNYDKHLEFDPYMLQSFIGSGCYEDVKDIRIVTFQYKISRREDRLYRERNW